MTEWVAFDVVLTIHDAQLVEHGGHPGIRDIGLLKSALARPQQLEAYDSPASDIAALAASYAFGIVRNHAFVDGNKRTSYVVTRTFLALNGYDLTADVLGRLKMWVGLSDGSVDEKQFAEWLRANIAAV